MVEKQNVTLSIPKKILRQAKIIAIERDRSLSGLMVELLARLVASEERYLTAKESHLTLLEQGTDMGTGGTVAWSRDSLHER